MKMKSVKDKNIKNNSILLMVLCLIVMGGIGFGSFYKGNASFNEMLASDTDDEYNYNFSGGEFDYQMFIGDVVGIQNILGNFQIDIDEVDFSTLKFISNTNDGVVKYDDKKKELNAISEGSGRITFVLNNENLIINVNVKEVNTSNASVSSYSLKKWQAPRFNVSVSGGKLSLVVWDSTGINTSDIVLYKVDGNKKNIKKLNVSFKSLVSGKSTKYRCTVTNGDALSSSINYFHLVVKDKNGYKTESYFSIAKKNNKYVRQLAPTLSNWKIDGNANVLFYVKDGSKIKSLIVYDLNNKRKVVLSKNNIVSSTASFGVRNLIVKSDKYNIEIYAEDIDGNSSTRVMKLKIVNKGLAVNAKLSSDNHNILFVGNSKSWRDGNQKNGSHSDERPVYEFLKMAKARGYIKESLDLSKFKFYVNDGANTIARTDEFTIATRSGSGLLKIANSSTYAKYISDKSYDMVFLQEYNYVSGASKTGQDTKETFLKGVKSILNKLQNKNAKIYIRFSWPNPYYSNSKYKVNYKFYRDKIYNNYDYILKELKKDKNYSGFEFYGVKDTKAFDRALGQNISVTLHNDTHQNNNGAYLVAGCMYTAMFKDNPHNLKYSGSVGSSTRSKLDSIAYDVCKDTN